VRNASLEEDERNGGDTAPIGFECSITPEVFPLESTHAQHVDEMLFSEVVLLGDITLKSGKDGLLLQELGPAFALEVDQDLARLSRNRVRRRLCRISLRGDREVLKFLPENDDGLLGEQGVLVGGEFGGKVLVEVLLGLEQAWEGGRPVERILGLSEEG